MKSGAILLEVLIASAVSAILATILLAAFHQTNRSLGIADDFIDIYAQVAVVHKQLEQDISGAMIPFEPPKEEKKAETKKTLVAKKEEKKIKPITKIFYGVNKDKNLDLLTFITNNPLRIYWGEQAGKPKPHIVRVVYRLKKQKGQPAFTLTRQESENLDFKAFDSNASKPIKAYELSKNIKELSISYTAEIKKENKDKKAEKKYKIFSQWDQEKQDEKEQKENLRKVPHGVEIKLVLWDDQQKIDHEFTFNIPIIPDVEPIKAVKKEPKKEEQGQQSQQMQAQVQRQLGTKNQILSFGLRK